MKSIWVNLTNVANWGDIPIGNKGKNLAELSSIGIRTPLGFALSSDLGTRHIQSVRPKIEKLFQNETCCKELSRKVRKVINQAPLNSSDLNSLQLALLEIMPDVKYFAVRSSGSPVIAGEPVAEDGEMNSLAGQFESLLMVPQSLLGDAVKYCISSLFNERSLLQYDALNDPSYIDSSMCVIIQEMCVAESSGVVMTLDPLEKEPYFGMEAIYGACEGAVSGAVQGDMFLINRNTGQVVEREIGTKFQEFGHMPMTEVGIENHFINPVLGSSQMKYALSDEKVAELFEICMKAEAHFGKPQDIEFVVSQGEIIITQSRPITTLS